MAPFAFPSTMNKPSRSSHPCDGCALRRVRCEGGYPCEQCLRRSLQCTYLRTKRKRGPKGPHPSSSVKVKIFQQYLEEENARYVEKAPVFSQADDVSEGPGSLFPSGRMPLKEYTRFLTIFKERLSSIWPILDIDDLLLRLQKDCNDFESYALAAATCSAAIAQLRLPEHAPESTPISSRTFAQEAQLLRTCFDYRERLTLDALLTSFFLHIYFSNADKLRSAAHFLRESLTYAQQMFLHQPDTYQSMACEEYELRLRIYWILFVSERTYCVQNGLPTTLRVIPQTPRSDMDMSFGPSLSSSFLALIQLFTYLSGDLLNDMQSPWNSTTDPNGKDLVSNFQRNLTGMSSGTHLDETQKVDILVTRNWIRTILWQYTITHFAVSCHARDPAFSALFPVSVAHDMLSGFSAVSDGAIRAHGYGMELKIFKIADALLDVLMCAPKEATLDRIRVDSYDALSCLVRVLLTVGGADSAFISTLRSRMAQVPRTEVPGRLLTLYSDVMVDSEADENAEKLVEIIN